MFKNVSIRDRSRPELCSIRHRGSALQIANATIEWNALGTDTRFGKQKEGRESAKRIVLYSDWLSGSEHFNLVKKLLVQLREKHFILLSVLIKVMEIGKTHFKFDPFNFFFLSIVEDVLNLLYLQVTTDSLFS